MDVIIVFGFLYTRVLVQLTVDFLFYAHIVICVLGFR